jgi:hypothetical protein
MREILAKNGHFQPIKPECSLVSGSRMMAAMTRKNNCLVIRDMRNILSA